MLGSEERLEYTLVGDTVNLAQRLQDLGRVRRAASSSRESTLAELDRVPEHEAMGEQLVKGRQTPVRTYRIDVTVSTSAGGTLP